MTNEGGLVIETVLSPHTVICFTCQNTHSRSWRGGATVKSNCCSCKGSQFSSQHPYQAACNSIPRVVSAPYSGLTGHKTCKCIHTQRYIYINFNNNTPKHPFLKTLVSTTTYTLIDLSSREAASSPKAHLLDKDNLSQLNYSLPEPHYILK